MSRQAQQQIDNLRNEVQNWNISTPRLATVQGQALAGIAAAYSSRRTETWRPKRVDAGRLPRESAA